jgi:hypothetical protein
MRDAHSAISASPSTHLAGLVHHDDPVGVAVQRDADVGAALAHLARAGLGVQRAAAVVDVPAVGLVADAVDRGAQLTEHQRRHAVGRAVGGVDHHLHALQRELVGEGGLYEGHIAAGGVVQALGRAHTRARGPPRVQAAVQQQRLDLQLRLVRELEAVRAEQLDAVVFVGVVRRADDHARVGAHAAGEVSDGRRGQRGP